MTRTKDQERRHYQVMNAVERYGPAFALEAVIDWMVSTSPEFDRVVAELGRLKEESEAALVRELRD